MNPTVPKIWPNATVVILAGGPSLTQADVDACREHAQVLAVKDAVRLAPWAGVLYACDRKWWLAHPETTKFEGPKYGLEIVRGRGDVTVLRNGGQQGIDEDPAALRTGQNSGYQAINLAVHLGATKIVLLGYDMKSTPEGKHHWFGWHPYGRVVPPYSQFLQHFGSMLEPLKRLGVSVVNCTPGSALETFPKMGLAEALS